MRAYRVKYTVLVSQRVTLLVPATCSDPVGIMDWGGVLFLSIMI